MKILVTGSTGMIGNQLVTALLDKGYEVVGVDRRRGNDERALNFEIDLLDIEAVKNIIEENKVDRIIHLAALAHSSNGEKFSYDDYYKSNVICAKNIFEVARSIPVLHISTIDVFGFTEGIVSVETPINPITHYGKTKALAEVACREICTMFSIFRLSPVYTSTIKRDIQKRYYLKYPNIAYTIGKGRKFEVLDVNRAVMKMVEWCAEKPDNRIHIIKDKELLDARECIIKEQKNGRAKYVLCFPEFIVQSGFKILKMIFGENKYTYLLNKAVNPLRTKP